MKLGLGSLLLAAFCMSPPCAFGQLLRDAPAVEAPAQAVEVEVLSPSLRQALATPTDKASRQDIRIVGSSSMRSFTERLVQDFGEKTGRPVPKVEPTGSREGIRRFCTGVGNRFPDIVASSRRMTKSEFNVCIENGIADIIELPIGLDAVMFVTKDTSPVFNLTPRHVYLALAAEVPRLFVTTANVPAAVAREAIEEVGEDFVDNPFKRWSEIDGNLPDTAIRVYGPSPTSGTRDFINSRLLEAGCRPFKAVKDIFGAADRVRQCVTLRAPPYFNEVEEPADEKALQAVFDGENGSLAIVTFDSFERERGRVEQLTMQGRIASTDSIAAGQYPLRRTIYYYVKRAHMLQQDGTGVVPGLRQFMATITSERVIGPGGLLDPLGFVPLEQETREQSRRDAGLLRRMER